MKSRHRWIKDVEWSNKPLGWKKRMSVGKRRAEALKHRGGNPLKAGRSLLGLSNKTHDKETKIKASKDAHYFFERHRIMKSKSGK
jgi:hypothetical protein